jgi:putative transposase
MVYILPKSSSTLFQIAPGELVNYEGQEYVVTRIIDLNKVLAKSISSKSIDVLEIRHLSPWVVNKEAIPDKPHINLTEIEDEKWAIARNRLRTIEPLLKKGAGKTATAAKIAAQEGIGVATVFRWLRMYRNTGLLSDLLPDKPGWQPGKWRLSEEVDAIIHNQIENFHLTDQRPSIAATTERIRTLCHSAGLPLPHWETIKRRIEATSERERFEKRHSKRAASQVFDPNEGTIPNANWPLAMTQVDHTLLPIMIVHEVTRQSILRPWVTFTIDVYSRMVTGMYLTLEAPSAMSAGMCITHAILPKEKWLDEIGLSNVEWPCWGVMSILHMDNAREFRGETLKTACLEYNIDIQFRPVKKPHYGGHIERLMGTASEKLKTIEGATFANPKEREEYASEVRAIMTLQELEHWLTLFIAKYHRQKHKGIGDQTPLERFQQGLLGGNGKLPRGLPARRLDEEKLRLDFMPIIERTIQSYGVVIDAIHYFADVLRPWVNAKDPANPKLKRAFKFRRDPRDISRLYFLDPISKRYHGIPYRNSSYPAISIWEFREAHKLAKKENGNSANEEAIFRYAQQQLFIQETAEQKTKAARRDSQRKLEHSKAKKKREKELPSVNQVTPAIPPLIPGYDFNNSTYFEDDD